MKTTTIKINPTHIAALQQLKTSTSDVNVFQLYDNDSGEMADVVKTIEAAFEFELEDHGIVSEPLENYDFEIDYHEHTAAIRVKPSSRYTEGWITHDLTYDQINDANIELID